MTSYKKKTTSTLENTTHTSSRSAVLSTDTPPSNLRNPSIIYDPHTKTPLSIFSKEGQLALIHYLKLIK